MKKIITVFICAACCVMTSYAQKTRSGSFNIQESNSIGTYDEKFGGSVFDVSFSYMWNIGKVFHAGLGAGVGLSNHMKYYNNWDKDDETHEKSFAIPVFARLKVDFGTKPTHGYFAAKIGTRLAFAEGYDGKNFNPYIMNITPAIGIDINVGGGNKLFIEAGVDANFSKYQMINYKWSDSLGEYIYNNFTNEKDGLWAGVYFSVGFSF